MPSRDMPSPSKSPSAFLVPLPLGLLASMAAHYGTSVAPWTFTNGIAYIANGRNLFTGPGLGIVNPSGSYGPLVSHPPLYPILLADLEQADVPILQAASWIDILSFGLFVGTSALFVDRSSSNAVAGVVADTWMILSPGVLLPNLGILSEPLSMMAGVLSMVLAIEFLRSRKLSLLLGSAAFCALALLTRFAAIVFFASTIVVLFLLGAGKWNERLKSAAISTAISAGPFGLILAANQVAGAAPPKGTSGSSLSMAFSFSHQLARVLWE